MSTFIHISLLIYWNAIDRFILRCCCCTPFCDRPGSEAKQSGHLRFLSWEHLRSARRPEHNTSTHPFLFHQTTSVFPSEIRHLGELTMVSKPSHQCFMCSVGDILTTMGTSIYQAHSTSTVQSGKTGTNACIFCRGRGQDVYSLGG